MRDLSNGEVIRKLRSRKEKEKDEAFAFLYQRMYKSIRLFILKNRGRKEEVEDIFHNGLIAFYLVVCQGKLQEDTDVEAYLFTICRNLWIKHKKKQVVQTELSEQNHHTDTADIPLRTMLKGERKTLIEKLLKDLGPRCHQLMILYYYDRLRMKEITLQMEFSGEQVAKNKKSKCLKKLRDTILESPLYMGLLR